MFMPSFSISLMYFLSLDTKVNISDKFKHHWYYYLKETRRWTHRYDLVNISWSYAVPFFSTRWVGAFIGTGQCLQLQHGARGSRCITQTLHCNSEILSVNKPGHAYFIDRYVDIDWMTGFYCIYLMGLLKGTKQWLQHGVVAGISW